MNALADACVEPTCPAKSGSECWGQGGRGCLVNFLDIDPEDIDMAAYPPDGWEPKPMIKYVRTQPKRKQSRSTRKRLTCTEATVV